MSAGGIVSVELDRHTALLAAACDKSPFGLAILDPDSRIRFVNPALAQVSGLAMLEHPGRHVSEVLPRLHRVEALLRRVLDSGTPVVEVVGMSSARARGSTGGTATDPARDQPDQAFEMSCYRLDGPRGDVLGVSVFLVDVTAREAALEAVAAAESRLRLVNEASGRIGSTLDLVRTAEEVVEVAVPRFADHAAVDLLDLVLTVNVGSPPHRLRRIASAGTVGSHRSGRSWPAEAGAGGRAPPARQLVDHLAGSPAARALAEGRTVMVAAAGGLSVIASPLLARGHVLGVASFVRSPGGARFTDRDVGLAEELAGRAALAIDNARLYTGERETAVALQQALLPRDRPDLTGIRVARRYLPAGRSAEVGGDWFDVVPLAGGRVALVVGDVMGRGVRAAAAMGQLRTAVRTLAVLDLMPEDVLSHLDDLAQSLDEVQLATCIYAVYDPVARQLRYATAGHLPPVLAAPNRGPVLLPLPSGAPLGVGGVAYESTAIGVADGTCLLLYTDGLVESRRSDIDSGLRQLVGALEEPAPDLELMCDQVLAALGGEGAHDDDVAILAARLEGVSADRCSSWHVPSDLAAVARARRLTRDRFEAWQLGALIETATLLVSELVTNAIRYARDPIELRLLLLGDRVEVAVGDSDSRLPRLRRAGADDEGGRGLHLVGTLARRWGARSTPTGKIVWFDLPRPSPDRALRHAPAQ